MAITLLKQSDLEELKHYYLTSVSSLEKNSSDLIKLISEALQLEGSLVRAQICLASFLSRGGSREMGLKLACGVEYFHLASLLLDDLPCMDNATERRGHACMHLKYGEANTILAALSLISRSYTLFYSVICTLDADLQNRCINLLDSILGLDGIVSGQALDLGFKYGGDGDKLNIRKIAMLKTASLFSLCILLPALATGASHIEAKNLKRFSEFSGLAYQIFDDFKDISLMKGLTEKSPRDKELSRPNIVLALGIEPAIKYLERVLSNISKTIGRLKIKKNNSNIVYDEIYSYFDSKFKIICSSGENTDLSATFTNNAL